LNSPLNPQEFQIHYTNFSAWQWLLKVVHYTKILFHCSLGHLIWGMVSPSKKWYKLLIILYDFCVIFSEIMKMVFCKEIRNSKLKTLIFDFSRKDKKCVLFVNKIFSGLIFGVIRCMTWISNKTCLTDFDRHSIFLQKKKIFMKIENVICWYFLCLSIESLKSMSFEKRIHSRNIFYKENEMKWSKFRNKSELNPIEIMKNSDVGHCNQNTTILWCKMIYKLIEFIQEIGQLIKIAGN
jgi:hypothetical protein